MLVLGVVGPVTESESARGHAFSGIDVFFVEEVGGRLPPGFGCILSVDTRGWALIYRSFGVMWFLLRSK